MRRFHEVVPGASWLRIRTRVSVALLSAAATVPAGAVITRLYPLAEVVRDASVIAECRVEAAGEAFRLVPLASVKGRMPGAMRLNPDTADRAAQKSLLRRHLAGPGEAVVFLHGRKMGLVYTRGAWLRIAGPSRGEDWRFVHFEPYLRRTFRGSHAELLAAARRGLAGKPLPAPDLSAEPWPREAVP